MSKSDDNFSLCWIMAPESARDAVTTATAECSINPCGAMSDFVRRVSLPSAVKKHIRGVLEGRVAIRFDTNVTEWSVQTTNPELPVEYVLTDNGVLSRSAQSDTVLPTSSVPDAFLPCSGHWATHDAVTSSVGSTVFSTNSGIPAVGNVVSPTDTGIPKDMIPFVAASMMPDLQKHTLKLIATEERAVDQRINDEAQTRAIAIEAERVRLANEKAAEARRVANEEAAEARRIANEERRVANEEADRLTRIAIDEAAEGRRVANEEKDRLRRIAIEEAAEVRNGHIFSKV